MPVNDQSAKLEENAADLRKLCQEQTGVDPAFDRGASDFHQTQLTVRELNRVRDALHAAARALGQQRERITTLEGRVSRLESSNGALMVDRTRGIDEAGTRAQYAWEVAERALEVAGIDTGELAGRVADHARYGHHVDKMIGEERERLEAFRITMVGALHSLDGRDGLTAVQVGGLRGAIERANNKACGR